MRRLYGVMGMYSSAGDATLVLRALQSAGYSRYEVYAPFPVEEIDELLPGKTRIGWVMLVAGICGCLGAYFLQWYATHDYPLNVGGRPLNSWPSFVPVTFELTVLTCAVVGAATLLILTRLPRLDYPTFNDPRFLRASQDRFFICVCADEPKATLGHARELLSPGAESVEEVYT